jgi:hypothetical protein
MNLQVVNGTGEFSPSPNGLGNIIIGYNYTTGSPSRTGSYYLVIGERNDYTGLNGIVASHENKATGWGASVIGSVGNTASGEDSSVSGGRGNVAVGNYASGSGGQANYANGDYSSILGRVNIYVNPEHGHHPG